MASYPPPTEIVSIFNEFFFEAPNASISMADVANNYLRKNTSDIATGFITFNNSLAVNGSITWNGTVLDLTGLGYVSGITPGTVSASKALICDSSLNLSGLNNFTITGEMFMTGNAKDIHIAGIGSKLNFSGLGAGIIMSSAISSIDMSASTLTNSIVTGGGITLGGINIGSTQAAYLTPITPGTVSASKAVVVDSNKDISAFRNLTATSTISGLVIVGLTMTCNGVDVGSNIAPLVGITLGTPAASKVLTLNASSQIAGSLTLTGNLTATNLTGTLQTAAQPNITSIGTLTSLTATSITGTLQTAAQPNITSIGTLTSLTATSITGTLQTAAQPNITSVGTLTSLNCTSLYLNGTQMTATATELNYLAGITAGTAAASKALVLNAASDILAIRNLSMTGNLVASTSITTASLVLGGNTLGATQSGYLTSITAGTAAASKALVVDSSKNIIGLNSVRMDSDLYMSQTAVLRICRDVSTGDLNSTIYSDGIASLCLSSIRGGGQVKVLTNANSTNNCFTINNATSGTNHLTMRADSKTGLYTNTPGYGLDVQSSLNCTSLYLNGTQITASATELNYCDLAGSAGTAEASKVMTLDASKNIATLNSLTSNYLTANLAINSPNAIASFGAVNIGPIVTAYGISSIKGTVGYSSAFFGSTNSILWMEGSNASPIEAEINISSGPGSTSTNGMRIGTCTANQFSLFTNATNRLIITSTGNVGIGDNASSIDKVFGILNGTVGSGIVDMRFGNALSTNNCFTMTYAPTSSGSGLNRLQFDPYGSSGALTILAKKYVGVGTTSPVCPLDVAGSESGLGILAPYQYAGATSGDGGYVASGTTTGVNINAIFRSNVIFDDKIYIRSDRRLKKDIAPLEVEQALRFVNEVDPVFYRKRDQPETSIQEIGYIAQDVMRAGFGNLITHTDNDKMHVEQEGDIEHIQFNVEYTKICAVLHAVIRDQQKCIESLTRRLEQLSDRMSKLA